MKGIKHIAKFGTNQPNRCRDTVQEVENGNLAVPVNNTLVCRTSFLATDHDT